MWRGTRTYASVQFPSLSFLLRFLLFSATLFLLLFFFFSSTLLSVGERCSKQTSFLAKAHNLATVVGTTVYCTQCGGTPTADASGAAKPAGWPCPNCQQGFSFVSLQEFLGHLPLRLLHICQAKSISEISALKSPFSSFF